MTGSNGGVHVGGGVVSADLRPDDPRTVGPYRLVGRLGEGGMAEVFLGESSTGRRVAVKVMRTELAAEPGVRDRFANEIEACLRVDGVCSVRYLAADARPARPWLAMEYVAGPTLVDYVAERGPLPDEQLRAVAAGIAEAIGAIHRCGLVHRDLKPSNVLMAADGPRVIDFGLAHAAEASRVTAVGTVVGSSGYMPPEQLQGQAITPAVDVFAWGATVAFAATGRSVFGTGTPNEVAQRVMAGVADLSDVPEALRPLVARALRTAPGDRPTVAELLTALVGGDTTQPAVTQFLDRTWKLPAPRTVATHTSVPPATVPPDRRARQSRAALVTIVVLLVLLAVATTVAVTGALHGRTTAQGATTAFTPNPPSSNASSGHSTDATASTGTMPNATSAPMTSVEFVEAPADTVVAPTPLPEAETLTVPPTQSGPTPLQGDLGLPGRAMRIPPCDGRYVVIVGSVTTPGQYEDGVARVLSSFPGSDYFLTYGTCASLRWQTDTGDFIYAVYLGPFAAPEQACRARPSTDTYVKRLDDGTTPPVRCG